MKHIWKQLTKEIFANKVFLCLMFLLSVFTPFMYYFVHFSVDGNMQMVEAWVELTKQQAQFENALRSNTTLAWNGLVSFTALTGFVYGMFYFRFFHANQKALGCIKALGYPDCVLKRFFLVFTTILSGTGAVTGGALGYFASDILMQAYEKSYEIEVQIKNLSPLSFAVGLIVPLIVFWGITEVCYRIFQRKEISELLVNANTNSKFGLFSRMAERVAALFPEKKQRQVRLMLRRPVSVLFIIASVCCFSIMFLLAYSLNLSSDLVFQSQMEGRQFLYDTKFDTLQNETVLDEDTDNYLEVDGKVEIGKNEVTQSICGLKDAILFRLEDRRGNEVKHPGADELVIGPSLQNMYGVQVGDSIKVSIGDVNIKVKVSAIAFNAEMNTIYMDKKFLANSLSLPPNTYTGVWSKEKIDSGDMVESKDARIAKLERDSISNRSSAVINQVIGCVIGGILLYLALLINFQDSTKDVLILHLMGYQMKEIKKMLVDIYRPLICIGFFATLYPSVLIVKAILKSLSLQIGDYLPFQTNIVVIVGIFLLLNVVYVGVQSTFGLGIRRTKRKDTVFEVLIN